MKGDWSLRVQLENLQDVDFEKRVGKRWHTQRDLKPEADEVTVTSQLENLREAQDWGEAAE